MKRILPEFKIFLIGIIGGIGIQRESNGNNDRFLKQETDGYGYLCCHDEQIAISKSESYARIKVSSFESSVNFSGSQFSLGFDLLETEYLMAAC